MLKRIINTIIAKSFLRCAKATVFVGLIIYIVVRCDWRLVWAWACGVTARLRLWLTAAKHVRFSNRFTIGVRAGGTECSRTLTIGSPHIIPEQQTRVTAHYKI